MDALPTAPLRAESRAVVTVRAPGRLHLGFLDPSGSLGRRFGSLGLVIEGFETSLEIGPTGPSHGGDLLLAEGREAEAELERVAAALARLRDETGLRRPLLLRLRQVLPAHAGFGSGTQLALAVGRAFVRWHGLAVDTALLARWLGRGLRSGIGIAGFDEGGLLVDGGPGADGRPAPLLARQPLPADWRIVVVQDPSHRGLSGADERRAIAALPPLPRDQAAEICHQVLMRVLPGAANAEFAPFAEGVSRIQHLLGEHFAPAQGGSAWTSPAVGRLMAWLGERHPVPGALAIGQSSWGPTGFAILPSEHAARTLVEAATAAGVVAPALSLRIVAGRNHGADLAVQLPR